MDKSHLTKVWAWTSIACLLFVAASIISIQGGSEFLGKLLGDQVAQLYVAISALADDEAALMKTPTELAVAPPTQSSSCPRREREKAKFASFLCDKLLTLGHLRNQIDLEGQRAMAAILAAAFAAPETDASPRGDVRADGSFGNAVTTWPRDLAVRKRLERRSLLSPAALSHTRSAAVAQPADGLRAL